MISLLLASACALSAREERTPTQRAAMEQVLAQDAQAGAARNRAPKQQPLAEVVRVYVVELRAFDLSRTPADFQSAWLAHAAAWEALLPYLQQHAEMRGEMHALFDWLLSESNPSAAEFERLHAQIWSTWAQIETAVERQPWGEDGSPRHEGW